MMGPAVYIAFEGSEGCGKSTHSRRLAEALDAVLTRETGGTPVGERLREILHDVTLTDLDARAEALMIAADRSQHMATVVLPALEHGRHVVSDRSVFSSLAYQGYGRGLNLDEIRKINAWAIRDRWPDLVILLEVPAAELERRLTTRDLDRFEREDAAFHQRVATGFADFATADPDRWVRVDATLPKDTVTALIRSAVAERLGL
jgi:dTMP kinase